MYFQTFFVEAQSELYSSLSYQTSIIRVLATTLTLNIRPHLFMLK